MKAAEDFIIGLIVVILFMLGIFIGAMSKQGSMLKRYCESTDYPNVIYYEGNRYCSDGETLKPIEWFNGK